MILTQNGAFRNIPQENISPSTHSISAQSYLDAIDVLSAANTIPPLKGLLQTRKYNKVIDIVCNATPDDLSKIELLSLIYSYLLTEMRSSVVKTDILTRLSAILRNPEVKIYTLAGFGQIINEVLPCTRESKLDATHEIEKIAVLHAEQLSKKIEDAIDAGNDYDMWIRGVQLFELVNNYFCCSSEEIFFSQKGTLAKIVSKFGDKYLNPAEYTTTKQALSRNQRAIVIELISSHTVTPTTNNILGTP